MIGIIVFSIFQTVAVTLVVGEVIRTKPKKKGRLRSCLTM